MPTISAIIGIHNEDQLLRDCLESLTPIDEIILLHDGPCTDKSLTIAQEYTSNIIIASERKGSSEFHVPTLVKQARGDWILKIDADERLSPELQQQLKTLAQDDTVDVYDFLWPYIDAQGNRMLPRLTKRKRVMFRKSTYYKIGLPHEGNGTYGRVRKAPYAINHILPELDIHDIIRKNKRRGQLFAHAITRDFTNINTYNCSLHDKSLVEVRRIWLHKHWPLLAIIILPTRSFLIDYILKEAYRAGYAGFVDSLQLATFHYYAALYTLKHRHSLPQ